MDETHHGIVSLSLELFGAITIAVRPVASSRSQVVRQGIGRFSRRSTSTCRRAPGSHRQLLLRALSIMPISPQAGWKAPSEYQLVKENTDFGRAAGKYIEHSKLLVPTWTAGCELALLFPEMKVVAPRLVTHYFANARNGEEGELRRQAQLFVEGDKSGSPQRLRSLEPEFRKVIETDRANAVAAPQSESERVLATLKAIDPGWHRVLEAGGLVLMLPSNAEPRG